MNISSKIIFCPKCLTLERGTRHHVYPYRFFGNGLDAPILYLCERCHQEIEKIIPRHEQLEPEEYIELVREFLAVPRRVISEYKGSGIY